VCHRSFQTGDNDVRVDYDHGQVRQTFVDGVLDGFDGRLLSGTVVLLLREDVQRPRSRLAGLVPARGHRRVHIHVLDRLRSHTVHNHRRDILVRSECTA